LPNRKADLKVGLYADDFQVTLKVGLYADDFEVTLKVGRRR
jgi:hypothetical protein